VELADRTNESIAACAIPRFETPSTRTEGLRPPLPLLLTALHAAPYLACREDEIVKQSIMRFLAANPGVEEVPVEVWKAVTSKLGNCRTVKQCRERWRNQLDPSIVSLPWTPDEDATIDRLRALHGNAWKLIASQLPGR